MVSALERADERRADLVFAGQAHRRSGLRQHDRRRRPPRASRRRGRSRCS
jgi:hypothetical protein